MSEPAPPHDDHLLTALHEGRAELSVGGRCLRGEELAGAAGHVAAQVAGAALATAAFRWLVPALPPSADRLPPEEPS